MRNSLFIAIPAVVCTFLLALACFFSFFWIRSFRITDDISLGEKSLAFRTLGISRFKSQGGGIWTEFRPSMVQTEKTIWNEFPANGGYCFAASAGAGLFKRLGFTGGRSSHTWVFPCWFPLSISIVLCFVVTFASHSVLRKSDD